MRIFLAAALCLMPRAALAAEGSYVQVQAGAYLAFLTAMALWGWSICRRAARRDVLYGLMWLMAILFLWMTFRYAQFALAFQAQFALTDWEGFARAQKALLRASQLLTWLALTLLPSLGLRIMLASERPDGAAPPRWSSVHLAASLALFALFLHGRTAAFAPLPLAAWNVLSLLGLAAMTFRASRGMPGRWRPAVPVSVLLCWGAYAWLYFGASLRWLWLSNFALVTAVAAFLFWEACLRCGVLPANSRYEQLFSLSPVRMQIVDGRGAPVYASAAHEKTAGGSLGGEWVQSSAKIAGGSVLWFDDVGELRALQAELKQLSERQARENRLLAHNNSIRGRLLELRWQNRLCGEVERAMNEKIEQASSILAAIPPVVDDSNRAAAAKAMARVNVIACSVKRKSNLLLTGMRDQRVPLSDVTQAMTESARCSASAGLECAVAGCLEGTISAAAGILLYDVFEGVLESCLKRALPSLFARLRQNDEGDVELALLLDSSPDAAGTPLFPPRLAGEAAKLGGQCSVTEDEGELHCVCKISVSARGKESELQ